MAWNINVKTLTCKTIIYDFTLCVKQLFYTCTHKINEDLSLEQTILVDYVDAPSSCLKSVLFEEHPMLTD